MMPSADHAQRVLSSLNQQRAAGKFCDAVLNLGDGVIHVAHRSILACFSEIFQQGNTATSSDTELCLQQCPKDGLEVLLNFVYTGELKLDPDNLDQVQNAAASLCIPEALALCQKFKETSAHALIIKRKRGRPRKSKADMEDNTAIALTKEESSSDTASCCTAATTTTRSGRVVKGPKRLVTDESSIAYEDPPPLLDKDSGDGENRISAPPTGDTKSVEPLVDIIDNIVSSKVSEEVEEDDFEKPTEDSDEEYVPVDNSSSSAPSTSAARRRKAQRTPGQDANDQTVEDDDPNKESVQCPICFKSFKSKYYLKVHNRRHTGDRPFACHKCGKRYFRKENLLIHELKNCEKTQSFTCQTCSTTFNGKEELRNHAITHLEDMPYKCSTCPEQFMYKKNLTFHMMKIHGYPKPHACPQCPKTFLTRTELRVHEAAKHRGEKPFVCEECGHRASSRNGLQMHIKAIHRNERPFVCNLCGHAFSQKNNLKMHQRVHSGEKPYQCHYCGKTFRTQASLYKHHRTHTGERPFSCDVCEQRFTEKGALVRHKASKHEEGRPHCCHICNKTFKAKEQLRVHLRRHKGMRKFECIDCGYKFTRQAHLRRHIQIHKRTENYNPRQRKLRNVIVQEVDESSAENELVDASLMTEETEYNTQTVAVAAAVAQQSANLQPDSMTGLAPSCIVRVVIESSDAAMEEAASNQDVAHMEAVDSFTVPEVLQQTQLVTKAYEPTLEMEGITENETENHT